MALSRGIGCRISEEESQDGDEVEKKVQGDLHLDR
jgi:hypothetical protein